MYDGLIHAADGDELPTVEGTPTLCDEIVGDQAIAGAEANVTCIACQTIASARRSGEHAKRAIKLGEQSGLWGAPEKAGSGD